MIALLDRFDALLYRGERAAVAVMLVLMGTVVFLDVVYRVTATGESKLVPDALEASLGNHAAPLWMAIVFAIVGVFAFRTRGDTGAIPKGAATGVAVGVALEAYVAAFPNGLPSPQTIALALTLWLGMAGACLAAYQRRHLALDVGSKLWPPSVAPKVAAVGHLVTAALCFLLLILGIRSIFGFERAGVDIPGHLDNWRMGGGKMTGTIIPLWVAAASIPVGSAVLAFRFTLQAVKVWTGIEVLGGDDTLKQLGIEDAVGGE